MASFGKVLDLFDDRYLELQDVVGNVEPLPTLVPYEEYNQNVLVYRMDTNHEIFLGLIQDFTMRRAHETGKELWTWFLQWEVDETPRTQQPSSPKKVRLDAQQGHALSNPPQTPRQAPALTIFERRTLDGALMLEEDMLRILIDIVQVASALVPNFIEFLYRWVDYYEGDGKALKAALRWEIPSLWDFEYHPLVLPRDEGKGRGAETEEEGQPGGQQESRARSASQSKAAELRQSSPTKKMQARPKPDLAAIELRTFYTEESERLQYREVKFGIQPPKLEQPLPPLINIPRDHRKRAKYYAACFKSRQRALYLLLEAGVSMRQINNYQKLQTTHPKETPETGDGNGLRNYQKDAKYAQAHFEIKEKQIKQREIAISNKLAAEAHIAASHAVPDGATGMPLIPPTPSYVKRPDMAAVMMQKIKEASEKKGEKINIVPKPLVGRMKSKIFENAGVAPLKSLKELLAEAGWDMSNDRDSHLMAGVDEPLNTERGQREEDEDDRENEDTDTESSSSFSSDGRRGYGGTGPTAVPGIFPNLPRPSLPMPLQSQVATPSNGAASTLEHSHIIAASAAPSQATPPLSSFDDSTPPNIATYMQNLNTEQALRLLPLLTPEARQTAMRRLQESSQTPDRTLQDRASETAEAVRSTDNYRRGSESFERGRLLSMPYPQPLPMRPSTGSPAGSETSLGRPLSGPSTLPPLTTAYRASTEQQDNISHGAGSNRTPSFYQMDSNSEPRAAFTKPMPSTRQDPAQDTSSGAAGGNTARHGPPQTFSLSMHSIPNPSTSAALHARVGSTMSASSSHASGVLPGRSTPSPIGVQQHATAEGSRIVPVYALSPTGAGGGALPSTQQASPGFSVEHFMYLRRQQEASRSISASVGLPSTTQSVTQLVTQSILPNTQLASSEFRPQLPSRHQTMPPRNVLLPPPPIPVLPSFPQLQPPSSPSLHSVIPPSSVPSLPHSNSMLPPPRPGITRNAPRPLSLPPTPTPFTTLAPLLTTSPFLNPSPHTSTPIQIYLPSILIPGSISSPSQPTSQTATDALLLGHENRQTGALELTKALLLPASVWPNTLRKVRSGRWTVLEAYPGRNAAPCHAAVYKKLEAACGIMVREPAAREELLTKRWRVSRGPMVRWARGAVWEGWAACVQSGIGMSAAEREGAVRGCGGDGGGDEMEEARRREMEELMDEDEDEEMDR